MPRGVRIAKLRRFMLMSTIVQNTVYCLTYIPRTYPDWRDETRTLLQPAVVFSTCRCVPDASSRIAALLRLGLTWSRTPAVTVARLAAELCTVTLDRVVREELDVVKAAPRTLPLIQPVVP
jgi:hypothetical protein